MNEDASVNIWNVRKLSTCAHSPWQICVIIGAGLLHTYTRLTHSQVNATSSGIKRERHEALTDNRHPVWISKDLIVDFMQTWDPKLSFNVRSYWRIQGPRREHFCWHRNLLSTCSQYKKSMWEHNITGYTSHVRKTKPFMLPKTSIHQYNNQIYHTKDVTNNASQSWKGNFKAWVNSYMDSKMRFKYDGKDFERKLNLEHV